MKVKGFFGFLLFISGLGIILLAGGCAFLLFVIDVGKIKSWTIPAGIVLFGSVVSWLGVLLMNSAGRDRAKLEQVKKEADVDKGKT
ncbi:MAG: hypothetical protein ACAH83_08670 [Alphaproteobacteria bacterium]